MAAEVLVLAGVSATPDDANDLPQSKIDSGQALEKLREMVAGQGGDLDAARDRAPVNDWRSGQDGYVVQIDCERLGQILIQLGGGRRVMTDRIDMSVGLQMCVRLGEQVDVGQSLVRVFASPDAARGVEPMLDEAIEIGPSPPSPQPLVMERVEP